MHPDDLPPALEWEEPIWTLYERIRTQWRRHPNGMAYALDYHPAITLIQAWGMDMDLALDMLQVVEVAMLERGNGAG